MPAEFHPLEEIAIALIVPIPLLVVWLLFVTAHNRIVQDPSRRIQPAGWRTAMMLYLVSLTLAAVHMIFPN